MLRDLVVAVRLWRAAIAPVLVLTLKLIIAPSGYKVASVT
jgi:hypothetical protein